MRELIQLIPARRTLLFALSAWRIIGAVALGLFVSGATGARAQCPPSAVRCELDTYAPTDPTYSLQCSNTILGVSRIDFDVPQRQFEVGSFDSYYGAELILQDAFTVSGPAPGTPIALRLRVRFNGFTHGLGRALVAAFPTTFEAGDDTTSRLFECDPQCGMASFFQDSLDLAITRPAGTPFGVALQGFVGYQFGARLWARYEFVGLPPGTSVTSCKGFNQEQPVPASLRSWGRLKAGYR